MGTHELTNSYTPVLSASKKKWQYYGWQVVEFGHFAATVGVCVGSSRNRPLAGTGDWFRQ